MSKKSKYPDWINRPIPKPKNSGGRPRTGFMCWYTGQKDEPGFPIHVDDRDPGHAAESFATGLYAAKGYRWAREEITSVSMRTVSTHWVTTEDFFGEIRNWKVEVRFAPVARVSECVKSAPCSPTDDEQLEKRPEIAKVK